MVNKQLMSKYVTYHMSLGWYSSLVMSLVLVTIMYTVKCQKAE